MLTLAIGFRRFHSISFPNEWGDFSSYEKGMRDFNVSIQLVSPTSGEVVLLPPLLIRMVSRFHSISFPNEWGEEIIPADLNLYKRITKFPFN